MTDKLFNRMNAKEKGFQCSFQKLFLSVSSARILVSRTHFHLPMLHVFCGKGNGGKQNNVYREGLTHFHAPTCVQQEILPRSVNHILYVDADAVFLTPVEDVWKEIHNDLDKKHFLGAAKERELDEDPSDQAKTRSLEYGSPVPHLGNSGASIIYLHANAAAGADTYN